MKSFFRLAFILALLLTLFLALTGCQLAGNLAESGTASGSVLFQDDFSNPTSGWVAGEDEFGKTEYVDGGFRIYVTSDISGKLSVPQLNFSDVRLEVDAAKRGGPDNNDFGLICRLVDENNFYFLEISSDGYYGIGKYKDNVLVLLSGDQMQTSADIQQGAASNHIRADCVGSQLALYVNGVKLAEVQDTDFAAGDVGMIAGTFEEPGVDILFDNFSVIKP